MNTKEKFEALIQAVKDQPDELFNMDFFGIKEECGTACCALGAFAQSKAGKSLGLKLDFSMNPARVTLTSPEGYRLNYDAGAVALGISQREAERMFNPDFYDGHNLDDTSSIPKEAVLDRIDEVARELGPWD